jgi:EAL domain-containing protein (putative c-di-GMP-specific phosphodiesterase class I)
MQIKREEVIKRELTHIATGEKDCGLYLQYQPILDLKTNRLCGFEALARLKTAELGKVPPLEFIPIAEKTKLIIPIGWEITRQAFRFLNKLKISGFDKIYVSINISAIQLMNHDFKDHLFEMINKMQVDPANVGIEITESVFASGYDEINIIMNQLRDCGLKIAIDDFGTGYSSLSRVRELNIDCVKIDKYFIDKILTIHDNDITSDIISIAHKLGHYTVAEGVEYEEQKQYLQNYGCDKIQGYLIGKPLDEEDAINLLKNRQI